MKKIKKIIPILITSAVITFPQTVAAAIENPVISDALGGTASNANAANSGSIFTSYLVSIWNSLITIGAIMTVIYLLRGAIEWINSGGDKGKIENARNRITQAIVGLIILVGSYAIISFISDTFFGSDFNVLNLSLPDNL